MNLIAKWQPLFPPSLQILCQQWLETQVLKKEYEHRLWQRLRIEWSYNSNHIEGNTLTYGETLLFLIHGRTRGEHLIREYDEMKGHDVAIEHIRSLASDQRPLTEADIRDLNRMLLKEGFWRVAQTQDGEPTRKWIDPGRYKAQPNHVLTATGEMFYFATPEETPDLMAKFVVWLQEEVTSPTLPLFSLLAQLHHRFIRIHPFDDGNGRVVRLLINYVLLRSGLPPLVIKSKDRKRYLEALAIADAGDLKPLEALLTEALAWALTLAIAASETLIPLESDAE